MFGFTQQYLNTLLGLFLALCLVVNCAPDPEAARREAEIMRNMYRLNDQNSYRLFRASRSNGKPTFIRFGKRSSLPSYNNELTYEQPADF